MKLFAMLLLPLTITGCAQALPFSTLNKKSTALDVLEKLNKSNKLASHITTNKNNDDQPVAIVSGGSSGIGIPAVKTLALAHMKVVLCAQNRDAATAAVRSLPAGSLQSNVRFQKLDPANMASIELAAKEIIDTEGNAGGIHALLNNVDVLAPPKREATAWGLELQFGANHVGHHMFTRLSLPSVNDEGRMAVANSTVSAGCKESGSWRCMTSDEVEHRRPEDTAEGKKSAERHNLEAQI
jgi:hypothetical protein